MRHCEADSVVNARSNPDRSELDRVASLEYERPAKRPVNPVLTVFCISIAIAGIVYGASNAAVAWNLLARYFGEVSVNGWNSQYYTIRILQNELVIGTGLVLLSSVAYLVAMVRSRW